MSWLTRLFRRRALEQELDREIQFHLDAATDDLVRTGVPREVARRMARLELGGPEQVKEATRDARGTRWVEDWWADTRFAVRTMARSPGFAAAAVLTLAIGIGANTAVWSIVDALMRRVLPIERPEQLHAIKRVGLENDNYRMSYPLMQRMQAALPDSIHLAGMSSISRMYATIGEQPEPAAVQLVSGSYFPTLGVRAAIGRVITPEDDRTLGGGPVAVLSEGYWERRFARNPSVIGTSMRLNGAPITIIGVARAGYDGLTVGQPADMFVPLVMQHEVRYKNNVSSSNADTEKPWIPQNGVSWLTLVARVDPVAASAVDGRLDAVFRADVETMAASRDSASRAYVLREHVVLEPIPRGFSLLRQQFGDPLRALMAGVGLVLLIACANLAGLLLARSAARTHEIAIRASLGARPGRLMRQVITESLTLSMIGGALGIVAAHWATKALLRLASSGTRAIPLNATLDRHVLGFAVVITVAAGLLFGLAPAVRIAGADLYDSFKVGARAAGSSGHRAPLGRLLVAAQIAVSLILVTSAGVFVRTFQNLLNIDPGYEREALVTTAIDPRAAGYTYEQLPGLYDGLLAAARAIPGVRSASLSLNGLASGSSRTSGFSAPGRVIPPDANSGQEEYVTPDYFRTTGIRITRGRAFTGQDAKDAPGVVMISEAAARRFFGGDSVIGARIGYGSAQWEIVGVVRDVHANSLREEPPAMVFHPLAQAPREYATSLEVRVAGDPSSVERGIRSAIASVDHKLPVRDVRTMEDLLERGLTRERMVARLAGAFAVLALLLAALGLYGVVSYSVARRTNEMGIRLALGASPSGVTFIVLRDCVRTVVGGLLAGMALWVPVLGLTRRLLYGLSPHDPATLTTSVIVLLAVGIVAGLVPALRASRIDPIESIRAE